MIAVAKIGGHQAIVKVGDVLRVDKLETEAGKKVKFETFLTSEEDGKNCTIGAPLIDGVMVEAKVLGHGRGDKIKVYKMKPRKRYRRTIGHRQDFSEIEITSIGGANAKAKVEPKKAEEKPTKPAAKKTTPAKKESPATKPASPAKDKKEVAGSKKVAKKDSKEA